MYKITDPIMNIKQASQGWNQHFNNENTKYVLHQNEDNVCVY